VIDRVGTLHVSRSRERSARLPSRTRVYGRVAVEHAVLVRRLIEVVRRLRLMQLEVPVHEEFVPRQVAEVEVLLAEELVAQIAHAASLYDGRRRELTLIQDDGARTDLSEAPKGRINPSPGRQPWVYDFQSVQP
jgi:hypothetical protein